MVFLSLVLYLQLSCKISQAFGWFAYRKQLWHRKGWLDDLDKQLNQKDPAPKDTEEKKGWREQRRTEKLREISELFMQKPIPEPDLCRAGRLRADLEDYSRRDTLLHRFADLKKRQWLGHLLWGFPKYAVLKVWYYASWGWYQDWKAHKHDYRGLMAKKKPET